MEKIYDALVIGAGPSGITAGIYLKRAGLNFLIFEDNVPGGKVNFTYQVENYPGFDHISGGDLAFKFYQQLSFNKITLKAEKIVSVVKDNNLFVVQSTKGEYLSKTVLIASGTREKKLGVKGEKEFFGKGVSSCAVCDGNFYQNQIVAVVGGGNSAFEEALYLSMIASKVLLIHRSDNFRADKFLIDKVRNNEKIEILEYFIIKEIQGENHVEKLLIENVHTKKVRELNCQAIFTYIGSEANTEFIQEKDILDSEGYICVNDTLESKIAGLFAAGDVVSNKLHQIVVACGHGALAASSINRFLQKNQ